MMIKNLFFLCLLMGTFLGAITMAQASDDETTLIIRGEYLSIAGDCSSCHSTTYDKAPYSGGSEIISPLGIVYSSNITPSKKNGIGNYTLEDFSNAVRYGKAPKGRLFASMPYTSFAGMSDRDIKALYTYFMKGVDPVDNEVRKTNLGFPFIRPAMVVWNFIFSDYTKILGSDERTSPLKRGEYLVKTLTHCSACHTPRNAFAAEDTQAFLSGGKVGAWTAPNITQDKETGIGNWSEKDIYTYLKTKHLNRNSFANGNLKYRTESSFSNLNDKDLYAMATYIKTVPAINNPLSARKLVKNTTEINIAEIENAQEKKSDADFNLSEVTGAQIYNGGCASCHGLDGKGLSSDKNRPNEYGYFPPLVGTAAVLAKDPSNLILAIQNGINSGSNQDLNYKRGVMPAFAHQLTLQELTEVTNYISINFGNPYHHITEEQVKEVLSGDPQLGFILRHAKLLAILSIMIIMVVFLISILCIYFYIGSIRRT